MKIIEFFESPEKEHWLEEIGKSDWRAAAFLVKIINENTFDDYCGKGGKLFILTDGKKAAAFATLSPKDCIKDDSLSPWIGFVYTFPEYRGRRLMGTLISHAISEAKKQGAEKIYICTDHVGLYEKYGFTYMESRPDIWDEISRIYYQDI